MKKNPYIEKIDKHLVRLFASPTFQFEVFDYNSYYKINKPNDNFKIVLINNFTETTIAATGPTLLSLLEMIPDNIEDNDFWATIIEALG